MFEAAAAAAVLAIVLFEHTLINYALCIKGISSQNIVKDLELNDGQIFDVRKLYTSNGSILEISWLSLTCTRSSLIHFARIGVAPPRLFTCGVGS